MIDKSVITQNFLGTQVYAINILKNKMLKYKILNDQSAILLKKI